MDRGQEAKLQPDDAAAARRFDINFCVSESLRLTFPGMLEGCFMS